MDEISITAQIDGLEMVSGEVTIMDDDGFEMVSFEVLEMVEIDGWQQILQMLAELPSGSLLASQLVSPMLLNRGQGATIAGLVLVDLLALLTVFSTFTDTFKDGDENVHYGIATFRGLWILGGKLEPPLPPQLAAKYKLKLIDFAHAFMKFLVFAAVAVFDQGVVRCFYQDPSEKEELVFAAVALGIAVICSVLFLVFPSKRHGIGFPLTRT